MERVYLLLGSNLGNKERNLSTAISLLVTEFASHIFSQLDESGVYESEPVGFESDNMFVNQAISFITDLCPQDILKVCKYVEKKMGRNVHEPRYDGNGNRIYEDRIIDIDILLYGKQTVNEPDLIIPHPGLKDREFAQIALKDIYQE